MPIVVMSLSPIFHSFKLTPYLFNLQVSKCAFAVILIGIYWVLEVMPIVVTSAYSIFVYFQVSKCAFAVILIGIYWVLEVMPKAVTSLIPICVSFKLAPYLLTFRYQNVPLL